MRARPARVYAVTYRDPRQSGPSSCYVVAVSRREASAIAAVRHPAARILEATAAVGLLGRA